MQLYLIVFTTADYDCPEWLFIARDIEPTEEEAKALAEDWQREVQETDEDIEITGIWIDKVVQTNNGFQVSVRK